MRAKTSTWFHCKVAVAKMQDDGTAKQAKEDFIIEALSWTEAEVNLTEELYTLYPNGFEIIDVKKLSFGEIFFSDNPDDGYWFKAKLQYITMDEKAGKEKKSNVLHLVQARTFTKAVEYIYKAMEGGMIDFTIHTLQETNILDVIEYTKMAKKEEANDVPEYEQAEQSTEQPAE